VNEQAWVINDPETMNFQVNRATLVEPRILELDKCLPSPYTMGLLDEFFDGVIATDENGRIASFNQAAQRLFGYESAEVLGREAKLIIAGPSQEEFARYLAGWDVALMPFAMALGIARGRRLYEDDSLRRGVVHLHDAPHRYVGLVQA